MAIYIEMTIILLSFIAVLSVLIVYIVKQTLGLKREYELQVEKSNADKELWIDRHESESNILTLPSKLDDAAAENGDEDEKTNLEHMITFTKRSSDNVHQNGGHFKHTQSRSATPSESGHYYEEHASDANEYSEYCVPNCEPIDNN